jgi:hypothetical protein
MAMQKVLNGNAYAAILRAKGSGRPLSLIPFRSSRVSVYQAYELHLDEKFGVDPHRLYYSVMWDNGTQSVFDREDILHIPNINFDGKKGTDDQPIAGWKMTLTGLTNAGKSVECFELTGEYGCVIFKDLWPGKYTVTEEMEECYFQTGLSIDDECQPVCDKATVDISRECLKRKIDFFHAKTWIYACA